MAKSKKMLPATYVRECALNVGSSELRERGVNDEVLLALTRIGNNINQIAKTANTTGRYNDEMLRDTLKDLAVTMGRLI